jgi:hypothetical protein
MTLRVGHEDSDWFDDLLIIFLYARVKDRTSDQFIVVMVYIVPILVYIWYHSGYV